MNHRQSRQTEPKAIYVRDGFNAIARRYDQLNDWMTFGLHRGWKREAARRLGCRAGDRILDLCSGTGDLALRASACVGSQGAVVALDFAQEMMRLGAQRAPKQSPIVWLRGDAQHLPFQDNRFDGALVGFGLRNVISIESALSETLRVLKPGAMLVNLDTAEAEWKPLRPLHRLYMSRIVPLLGRFLAGSEEMYGYLASSAAAFDAPQILRERFEACGFVETGFVYRPRFIGGAALVWGRKPIA